MEVMTTNQGCSLNPLLKYTHDRAEMQLFDKLFDGDPDNYYLLHSLNPSLLRPAYAHLVIYLHRSTSSMTTCHRRHSTIWPSIHPIYLPSKS